MASDIQEEGAFSLDISDSEIAGILHSLNLTVPALLPINIEGLPPGGNNSNITMAVFLEAVASNSGPENDGDSAFSRVQGVLKWCTETWEERENQEAEVKRQR